MSGWTHAICVSCWNGEHPDSPARGTDDDGPGQRERCCWCARSTNCGIYVRADPNLRDEKGVNVLRCKGIHGEARQ